MEWSGGAGVELLVYLRWLKDITLHLDAFNFMSHLSVQSTIAILTQSNAILVKCRLRTCGADLRTGKSLRLVWGFMLRVRVSVRVSVRVKIKVRVGSSILPYCRSAGPVRRFAVRILPVAFNLRSVSCHFAWQHRNLFLWSSAVLHVLLTIRSII